MNSYICYSLAYPEWLLLEMIHSSPANMQLYDISCVLMKHMEVKNMSNITVVHSRGLAVKKYWRECSLHFHPFMLMDTPSYARFAGICAWKVELCC